MNTKRWNAGVCGEAYEQRGTGNDEALVVQEIVNALMMGDALTDDHHNESWSILKDLTDSTPEGVAKILKCYDYDCNGDEILKELKKFYKTELQLAAHHLKQLPYVQV